MSKRKRTGSGGPAAAIGGMLAGFDHQIFRTTPPPHELVLKARPVRGLSGDGGEFEVSFPDDLAGDAAVAAADPTETTIEEADQPGQEPGPSADPTP